MGIFKAFLTAGFRRAYTWHSENAFEVIQYTKTDYWRRMSLNFRLMLLKKTYTWHPRSEWYGCNGQEPEQVFHLFLKLRVCSSSRRRCSGFSARGFHDAQHTGTADERQDIVWIGYGEISEPCQSTCLESWYGQFRHGFQRHKEGHHDGHLD